jgi:hypothetical protein
MYLSMRCFPNAPPPSPPLPTSAVITRSHGIHAGAEIIVAESSAIAQNACPLFLPPSLPPPPYLLFRQKGSAMPRSWRISALTTRFFFRSLKVQPCALPWTSTRRVSTSAFDLPKRCTRVALPDGTSHSLLSIALSFAISLINSSAPPCSLLAVMSSNLVHCVLLCLASRCNRQRSRMSIAR